MNSSSNNQPRAATVEQGALPHLPEWSFRDDLGGRVPSEIRTALNEHARDAWNMGLNAGLLHAPAISDTGLPELRDHLATAKVMGSSITLSPVAAGALHAAMTTPPMTSLEFTPPPVFTSLDDAMASSELKQLKAVAQTLAAGGTNWSMDVGCMFVLAMIERIEALTAAQQVAGYIDRKDLSRLGNCRATLWATTEGIDAMPVYLATPADNARIAELEAKIAKHRRSNWILGQTIHNIMVGNQSAWIEWQHGAGAEEAMSWVHNGLVCPGLIPELPHAMTAQQWFEAKSDYRMEPSDPHPAGKEL